MLSNGVCNLLAHYDLIEKLSTSMNISGVDALQAILRENIRDTCDWVSSTLLLSVLPYNCIHLILILGYNVHIYMCRFYIILLYQLLQVQELNDTGVLMLEQMLSDNGLLTLDPAAGTHLPCTPEEPTLLHLFCFFARHHNISGNAVIAVKRYFAPSSFLPITSPTMEEWVRTNIKDADLQCQILPTVQL